MSDKTTTRTAETVALLFVDDGTTYETADGTTLDEVCLAHGAARESGGPDGKSLRYVFGDGSAIIDCGQGWDLEGATPWKWEEV